MTNNRVSLSDHFHPPVGLRLDEIDEKPKPDHRLVDASQFGVVPQPPPPPPMRPPSLDEPKPPSPQVIQLPVV